VFITICNHRCLWFAHKVSTKFWKFLRNNLLGTRKIFRQNWVFSGIKNVGGNSRVSEKLSRIEQSALVLQLTLQSLSFEERRQLEKRGFFIKQQRIIRNETYKLIGAIRGKARNGQN
jgi:hypothetical protein